MQGNDVLNGNIVQVHGSKNWSYGFMVKIVKTASLLNTYLN